MNQVNNVAYILLQNKYIESNGISIKNFDDVLKKQLLLFPENWEIYDVQKKIELLTLALKQNKTLNEVMKNDLEGV